MSKGTDIAPAGTLYVCACCDKRARSRYGFDAAQRSTAIDRGWDGSCMLHAVLCHEERCAETGKWVAIEVRGARMTRSPQRARDSRYIDLAVLLTIAIFALRYLLGCSTLPAAARPMRTAPYLQAWLAAGYPRGECDDLDVRVIAYTDQAELNRDCETPAWGCTTQTESGFLGVNTTTLIRAISNNPAHEFSWVVAHELVHALHWCGMHGRDPNHVVRELWGYYDEPTQRWVEGMEHRVHKVLVP